LGQCELQGRFPPRCAHRHHGQTAIYEEILATQGVLVTEEDLKAALSLFDPVWDELFPREQARILRLLIERIDYHGGEGTLEITFRDTGIRALCKELDTDDQEA
jgi:hypothetical protein